MITKSIGKNTVGQGDKMNVALRNYERSSHDLSFAWRSTMGVGTLVPSLKLLALPGDTFDIDIDTKIMTHPTVGPLFGSYKFQTDVFVCPIRLYQAMLHNNALGIGMDMSKVKLPQLRINTTRIKNAMTKKGLSSNTMADVNKKQINPSCILSYLGIKAFGSVLENDSYFFKNAVPILAYVDIFKNYYANKQEDNFYYILPGGLTANATYDIYTTSGGVTDTGSTMEIQFSGDPQGEWIKAKIKGKFGNLGNPLIGEISLEELITNMFIIPTLINDNEWIYKFIIPNAIVFEPEDKENRNNIITSNISTITKEPLQNLDEVRENLLKAGKTQVLITAEGDQSLGTKYFEKLLEGGNTLGEHLNTENQQSGLIIKTYQSDIFNNFVSSEFVNTISNISSVSTLGNKFSIDALNLAQKVYNMLNRIAVSGGTYRDWIETVYTNEMEFRAETPIYEGGISSEIQFEEIVSYSASEEQPLGTLGGRGISTDKKGGKLHIKIEEPSYIIGISSITPRVDYSQGQDWDVNLQTMNDLHKPALDGIGYQDVLEEWCNGNMPRNKGYGKTVAWVNYMTNYNKTFGNFAVGENEEFMCLNRAYDIEQEEINTSTYIDPNMYNYTFAVTSGNPQNFWVQIGWGINARRKMSAKQIPTM